MTLQVARIAATRLKRAPAAASLLCRAGAAGQGVRAPPRAPVRSGRRRADRRRLGATADAEVVLLAAEALAAARRQHISRRSQRADPGAGGSRRALGLRGREAGAAASALDRKDAAAVAAVAGPMPRSSARCCAPPGRPRTRWSCWRRSTCRPPREAERPRWAEVVDLLLAAAPRSGADRRSGRASRLRISERHQLHPFSRGVGGELGRGGRYGTQAGEALDRLHALHPTRCCARFRRPSPPRRLLPVAPACRRPRPRCAEGLGHGRGPGAKPRDPPPRRGGSAAPISWRPAACWSVGGEGDGEE